MTGSDEVADSIPREMNDEFMRTAFERCPSGLLIVDTSGRIVVVNEEVERLFGYERDELVGQPVEMLIPDRFVGGHAAHRDHYHRNPSTRAMGAGRELHARHRDGRDVPVEIGLSTIPRADGLYILSTIVDVTERRRIEERLRQTHKLEAVGALASGIAHDFNNILLGIIGYAELARDAIPPSEAVQGDLRTVIDNARRGRDLVNRILSFSRQNEPRRSEVTLDGPVREAMQLLSATLPPDIEMRHGFDPSTPVVVADSMELHQIIMNLATNAAYAMKQRGGVLDVRVAPLTAGRELLAAHPEMLPGLYARLTVSDSGNGIPPEHLPRIFDPFYSTKPSGEGTGLGLSVIARIVRSLGGCITVASEVGVGSRFEVYLPSALAKVQASDADAAEPAARWRVLLVEDEEQLATLAKRTLESGDFRVNAHTSSLQALEVFRANPQGFDLVITDNTMPHMTGLQLVARVLEIRHDVPIMMVSGIGDSMGFDELRKRGVRRLLPKPYLAAELRAAALELVLGPASDSP